MYKGGIVSSDLIDIEVLLKNNTYIKSKMIVDPCDNMELLYMRICEIIEKFPKLSGLNGLIAKDLAKKSPTGLVSIKKEGNIGDSIKPKDVIIFDLEFSEIWLEVEMALESEDNNLKITFELKVRIDSFIADLKHVLIKMGIKSWVKLLRQQESHDTSSSDQEDNDYYIFSHFSINFSDKGGVAMDKEVELDNFHGIYIYCIYCYLFRKNIR